MLVTFCTQKYNFWQNYCNFDFTFQTLVSSIDWICWRVMGVYGARDWDWRRAQGITCVLQAKFSSIDPFKYQARELTLYGNLPLDRKRQIIRTDLLGRRIRVCLKKSLYRHRLIIFMLIFIFSDLKDSKTVNSRDFSIKTVAVKVQKTPLWVSAIVTEGKNNVTSLLLRWIMKPFLDGIYSWRKEMGANSFL